MAQLQNKDILNAIRDEQSAEYQNNIPVATGSNDLEVYASLEAYPTAKNEFISSSFFFICSFKLLYLSVILLFSFVSLVTSALNSSSFIYIKLLKIKIIRA